MIDKLKDLAKSNDKKNKLKEPLEETDESNVNGKDNKRCKDTSKKSKSAVLTSYVKNTNEATAVFENGKISSECVKESETKNVENYRIDTERIEVTNEDMNTYKIIAEENVTEKKNIKKHEKETIKEIKNGENSKHQNLDLRGETFTSKDSVDMTEETRVDVTKSESMDTVDNTEKNNDESSDDSDSKAKSNKLRKILSVVKKTLKIYVSLFKRRDFWFCLMFTNLGNIVIACIPLYLPALASELGLPTSSFATFLFILSLAELGSRLLFGFVGDSERVNKIVILAMTRFVCGIATIALLQIHTHPTVYALTVILGVFGGPVRVYFGPIVLDIVGFKHFGTGIAFVYAINGLFLSLTQIPLGK